MSKPTFWRRKDRRELTGTVLCEHGTYVWFQEKNTMPQTMLRFVLLRDWEPLNHSTRRKQAEKWTAEAT